MIPEFFINIGFSLLESLLSVLPDVSISFDTGILSTFFDFIDVALYIFPFQTVAFVIGAVISFNVFKIIISSVRTIWDLLPFV